MDEMRALVDRLNETAYAYYTLSKPLISDAEWDKLYDRLLALERKRAFNCRIHPPIA